MSTPATRLYKILARAASIDPHRTGFDMLAGWRETLYVPENTSDLKVIGKIGRVMALPEQIERMIDEIPGINSERFLGWREGLTEAFLACNFRRPFSEFSTRLTEALMVKLEFCFDKLESTAREQELSEAQCSDLKEAAWKLYSEVQEAEMPDYIKRYIRTHVGMIIEALDDYDISGTLGIEVAVNTAIGSIATNPTVASESTKTPSGSKMWDLVGRVALLLKMSDDGLKLADRIMKAIE